MAPSAVAVNDLLNTLEEEDCKMAIAFIEYLSEKRQKTKEEKIKGLFSEFQNILAGDKGWDSEEDMIKEMAQFRKERLGL